MGLAGELGVMASEAGIGDFVRIGDEWKDRIEMLVSGALLRTEQVERLLERENRFCRRRVRGTSGTGMTALICGGSLDASVEEDCLESGEIGLGGE